MENIPNRNVELGRNSWISWPSIYFTPNSKPNSIQIHSYNAWATKYIRFHDQKVWANSIAIKWQIIPFRILNCRIDAYFNNDDTPKPRHTSSKWHPSNNGYSYSYLNNILTNIIKCLMIRSDRGFAIKFLRKCNVKRCILQIKKCLT